MTSYNHNEKHDNKHNDNDTKQNIWQQIIKEASTQKEIDESHVFIFGDKNTGKRSLIKAINKEMYLNYENEERNLPTIDEANSKYSFVEFKYLNVKKTNDSENGIFFINKRNYWEDACMAYK